MNILEAIKTRRSIAKMQDKSVPKAIIENIVQAGCWAPTYKRTEPWNFVVFAGQGREKLQQAINAGFEDVYANLPAKEKQQKLNNSKSFAYRAPVIIAVWSSIARGKINPEQWEDEAAVSACLQNMALTAHGLGLATIWRTGPVVNMLQAQALCSNQTTKFDAAKGDRIIGFLYIGYEDEASAHPAREKPDFNSKTTWIEN